MREYPDWVEVVTYFGLDPITVWVEYRIVLYAAVIASVLIALISIYWAALRFRGFIANYKHTFSNKIAFYRGIEEMPENSHVEVEVALEGEALVYAFPAVAVSEVEGFRKSVGLLLLTKSRLIFASKGAKCEYSLDSFRDANIKDGIKWIELKLIFEDRKPLFHLLGVNRDHAQEIFMKMHAFRVALKDQTA